MTHPNFVTNGASLEDCHTNFFALVDNNSLSLTEDKALSDLSEEQLRDVLEQLTDHNLPDSKKCPLVRRLNAENASKDESDLMLSAFSKSSSTSSSCRNSGRKSRYALHRTGSKDAEFEREKSSANKKVHSSQSLQDLLSTNSDYDSASMRSIGATRNGKRLNKASRANSFTMSSGTQNFCNNANNCGNSGNNANMNTNNNNNNSNNNNNNKDCDLSAKSGRKSVKVRPPYISTSSTACTVSANDCDYEAEVANTSLIESSMSSPIYKECYATQSIHFGQNRDNHNIDCDNSTTLCNTARDQNCSDNCEFTQFEMQDLRKKANIIEYTSDIKNDCFESEFVPRLHHNKCNNNVDSFMNLRLNSVTTSETIETAVAEPVVNHHLDYDSTESNFNDENKSLQSYQAIDSMNKPSDYLNRSIPSADPDIANLQQISPNPYKQPDPTLQTNSREKKKKKAEQTKILAEHIEGHIGYKDIEFLTSYVNSAGNEQLKQSSPDFNKNTAMILNNNNNNYKESSKKKDKGNVTPNYSITKRKNVNNVSQNRITCGIDSNKNNESNIPLSTSTSSCSSDDTNISKHSEIAQKTDSLNLITDEITSLINSSSHNKDFASINRDNCENLEEDTQLFDLSFKASSYSFRSSASIDEHQYEHQYAASDSEMPDRELGFVVPKSKHLKRRIGQHSRNHYDKYGHSRQSPITSVQSSTSASTSTTPSSSTVSGAGVYARGYESEREYSYESKDKQDFMRRKSTSSVPHSEQNSAYNSDGELSSHSMPIRNDSNIMNMRSQQQSRTTPSSIESTPKASYADIAKSLNFGMNSFFKKSHMNAISMINPIVEPLSINTNPSVQYEEFPQLDNADNSLAVTDESPESPELPQLPPLPPFNNDSKIIEALISPSISMPCSRNNSVDSNSAPTSTTNTPMPPQNECLLNETAKSSETESLKSIKVCVVPAVIMCDYSDSVPVSDIGEVTFGFFDDLSASQQTVRSNVDSETRSVMLENHLPDYTETSHIKPSLDYSEHQISVSKVSAIRMSYIDVDKKSFNYEHIIGFIKKAWEDAKRDYQKNYQSSSEVKYYRS